MYSPIFGLINRNLLAGKRVQRSLSRKCPNHQNIQTSVSLVILSSMSANGSGFSLEIIGEMQIIASVFFFAFSFSMQRQAMLNGMSPITYNVYRYIVSTALLFSMKYIMKFQVRSEDEDSDNDEIINSNPTVRRERELKKTWEMWFYGIVLGVANFGGSILQQVGLVTVTAGKTGFITGMYVVFVPLTEYFVPCMTAQLTIHSWIAALMSMFGLYLLSGCAEQDTCLGGAIKEGEVLVFISMFFWVISIIAADFGSKKLEVVTLQLVDFFVTTLLTIALAVIVAPDLFIWQEVVDNWVLIVVVGITEAVAFTLSTMGQIYSTPSRAALLFSLEAVCCAVFSYFLLGETLSYIEVAGGALMTAAALVSSSTSAAAEETAAVDQRRSRTSSSNAQSIGVGVNSQGEKMEDRSSHGLLSTNAIEEGYRLVSHEKIPKSFGSIEMTTA